ncbi:PEP-CTERM sorting domain-containing protein [Thalassoglobus sp. JC818]|uniref:PEP-CTERM sorting domain-containing protein n=1 Tax=Thalassoglobus sp. JC818 TaxID=3232136 RepID=UPI00345A99DC
MLRRYGFAALFAALIGAGFCNQSEAGFIIFTDRAAFDAAIAGGITTDSFEDGFATGDSVTRVGFSMSETGGLTNSIMASDAAMLGFLGLGGANTEGALAGTFADDGNSVLTFNFDSPINAFGIDLTSNVAGSITIGGDVASSVAVGAGGSQFFGVINTTGTFDELTVGFNGEANIGFDDLDFGNADLNTVPEPGTMALFAFGALMMAGGYVYRQKGFNL